MNIINEGEIVINDKTRAGEVAQIMVTAGLYDATEDVPVYENDGTTPKEAGVSIHEVYGNIDTALQEVADKCKEAGIILNGQVCYSGDYYGRYYITDNVVEDLTADEIGVREASDDELIAELKRRGLEVTVQKNQPSESENSAVELEKTYRLAGYNWTVCELVNGGRTAVIQSHGVTSGAWLGYKMPQFGNGEYYKTDIDGQDISNYDNKTQTLYDTIKDVEDKSAPYGKGLYLVSKEKVGFTEEDEPGSGNYWQALKATAENARSLGCPCSYAWLGTVYGSDNAWCVSSNGCVCNGHYQGYNFVVAPAFNLDLSKVEVVGDEIIIKSKKQQIIIKPKNQKLEIDKMLTISSLHVSADTKDLLDQAADDNEEDPMPPVYEKQGYGWLVACDPDNEETWDNYPADLVQCMKLTRDNGCFWLCLDADGPRVETLEFFD